MGSTTGIFYVVALVFTLTLALHMTNSLAYELSPNFYDQSCPTVLPAIKRVVEAAVQKERRMGASLLPLHFHDCFVNVSIRRRFSLDTLKLLDYYFFISNYKLWH